MLVDSPVEYAFVVLFLDRDEADRLVRLLSDAGEPGCTTRCVFVVPPVRGSAFFAGGFQWAPLVSWWNANVPFGAHPVYVARHVDGLAEWIAGLDGTFCIALPDSSSAAHYAGMGNVETFVEGGLTDFATMVMESFNNGGGDQGSALLAPAASSVPLAAAGLPDSDPAPAVMEPAAERGRPAWRSALDRRQFLAHNVVAGMGALFAGLFGFALQAMLSHRLRPAEYGKAFAVFTFFLVLTQPAGAFSRLMAWATSRDIAVSGHQHESNALLRSSSGPLLLIGALTALACCLAAPALAGYLGVPSIYVVLSALGVPFMLATPPLLGALQGAQRFTSWSVLSIVLAASRVVCAGALVLPYGVRGVLLGISIASALTYAVGVTMVWSRLRQGLTRAPWRRVSRFLIISVASTMCLAVLLGSDTILVKHFFSNRQGGEYSSVVAISRAVFFAMGGVASVLFPKVVARHARGHGTIGVVMASLALTMLGALGGMVVFELGGRLILQLFAGHAYVGGAAYIGWYALGMGMLAAVSMLLNTQQSRDRLSLLAFLLPLTLLKPALLLLFHQTLLAVVLVSDVSFAVVLVVLVLLYASDERSVAALHGAHGKRASLSSSSLTQDRLLFGVEGTPEGRPPA